ncbi:sulfotransferase domain-containing protein [Acidocella sp.]|uniref:sulfotransferase domain-containing protein n=1 Tax=Acidocella sp. TaxID=50710 RepID=UPI002606D888|nr:sulfotransferase domain-containing protein [Acidocella sp.]
MGKIVWLASYPKSGNTWLRVFLHNYITQAATPHSINRLTDFSLAECAAALFHAPGETLSDEAVQKNRPRVHAELAGLGPELVFVKTHNANLAVHGVALVTPEVTAGAVYVVRDPRDVAVSYAAYLGRDVDETIRFMAAPGAVNGTDEAQVFELLSSWSGHVRSWVGGRQRLLVRYEDLVAEPERYFARIIRYLGTGEVDQARLTRAIGFSSFAELAGQEARDGYEASGGQGRFFRAGRVGVWREALSPAQAARIERDHGEVMGRLGYLA